MICRIATFCILVLKGYLPHKVPLWKTPGFLWKKHGMGTTSEAAEKLNFERAREGHEFHSCCLSVENEPALQRLR